MGNEPVFLSQYLYSDDDMERHTLQALEKAGVEPAKIYAYRKTGYLVSESCLDSFTGAAIQEWDDAIDEFDAHGGDPSQTEEGQLFDNLLVELEQEIESLIILFGLTTDAFLNTPLLPHATDSSPLSPTAYQALCVARTHRTLRSISCLLDEHMGEDVLKLARSIYENYLHIIFTAAHPQKTIDLVDAVLGLKSGTHVYRTWPNGKADKRVIVEVASGTEYEGHISAYRMADSTNDPIDRAFFDFFYERTSQFLHPSVFSMDRYIFEHGLDAVQSHSYEEGIIFSAAVGCMVADQMRFMQGCPAQTIADVVAVVSRITGKLLAILDLIEVWKWRMNADGTDIQLLKQACKRLGKLA